MIEKKKIDMKLPKITLDDLFTTQEQRDDEKLEKVLDIDISNIDNFPNHPFKVLENEDMNNLINSVKLNGIINPLVVRKKDDGRYELISGHRRKFAGELLGLDKLPCIVRDVTDEEATIMMVDSNNQREKILPSEKAFAYKMKYDALKHQGKTSGQFDRKLSSEIIGNQVGESEKTIRRYISLTKLNKKILDMVDIERIALSPAYQLSFLKPEEQEILLDYMEMYDATPTQSQAIQLKELSKENKLTSKEIESIIEKEKPNQLPKLRISESKIRNVLPKNINENKVEDYILKSIEFYTKYLKKKELGER